MSQQSGWHTYQSQDSILRFDFPPLNQTPQNGSVQNCEDQKQSGDEAMICVDLSRDWHEPDLKKAVDYFHQDDT